MSLEYAVVREEANYGFEAQVRRMIRDGWEPLGGVQVVRQEEAGYRERHYQAMIRRTPKRPWWKFWGTS